VDFAANQNSKSGCIDQCGVSIFILKKFRIDASLTFSYLPAPLGP
jgi:hypothetical protein